jgi:hypothetical protein
MVLSSYLFSFFFIVMRKAAYPLSTGTIPSFVEIHTSFILLFVPALVKFRNVNRVGDIYSPSRRAGHAASAATFLMRPCA